MSIAPLDLMMTAWRMASGVKKGEEGSMGTGPEGVGTWTSMLWRRRREARGRSSSCSDRDRERERQSESQRGRMGSTA